MIRVWTAIALIVVSTGACLADSIEEIAIKSKGAGPLFRTRDGKQWGYMDRAGKVVIPPQFDWEGDFFSGLASVQKNGKWGYVDEVGRLRIPFQFDNAGSFHEGLAAVQAGRQWGYIDSTGKIVIRPQFQGAAAFNEGMGRVAVWETIQCDDMLDGVRFKDQTKDDAPLSLFGVYSSPHCKDNRRFGFVRRDGTVSISPQFSQAYDFSEGLAVVRIGEGDSGSYGFIDKTGKVTIGPTFELAGGFSEGVSWVTLKAASERSGFIDHSGHFVIPPRFERIGSFSEGLALAQIEGGRTGFIDKRGTFVIPPKFDQADDFSDGLALVRMHPERNTNAYFIDRKGRAALRLKLQVRWSFSDGLTVAGKRGKQVYVDRHGAVVAPYEIDPDSN